jgi:hypothetical protein
MFQELSDENLFIIIYIEHNKNDKIQFLSKNNLNEIFIPNIIRKKYNN